MVSDWPKVYYDSCSNVRTLPYISLAGLNGDVKRLLYCTGVIDDVIVFGAAEQYRVNHVCQHSASGSAKYYFAAVMKGNSLPVPNLQRTTKCSKIVLYQSYICALSAYKTCRRDRTIDCVSVTDLSILALSTWEQLRDMFTGSLYTCKTWVLTSTPNSQQSSLSDICFFITNKILDFCNFNCVEFSFYMFQR